MSSSFNLYRGRAERLFDAYLKDTSVSGKRKSNKGILSSADVRSKVYDCDTVSEYIYSLIFLEKRVPLILTIKGKRKCTLSIDVNEITKRTTVLNKTEYRYAEYLFKIFQRGEDG